MADRTMGVLLAAACLLATDPANAQVPETEDEVAQTVSLGLGASFLAGLLAEGQPVGAAGTRSSGPNSPSFSAHHLWATNVFGGVTSSLSPSALQTLSEDNGLGVGLNGTGAYLAAFVAQHEAQVGVLQARSRIGEDDGAVPTWILWAAGLGQVR